jgi:hypothetical protein
MFAYDEKQEFRHQEKVCCQGFGPGKRLAGKPIRQKCLINANN